MSDPIEVWRLRVQFPALKRRELLNLVLMKWFMGQGKYDESTCNADYLPASEYPVLPPSFEYTPKVSAASHS